jgi:hypothetical protein
VLDEPGAPRGRHAARDPQSSGDLSVREPVRGQQHDPRALRQRLRTRPPPCPALQLRALVGIEHHRSSNSIRDHRTLSLPADY